MSVRNFNLYPSDDLIWFVWVSNDYEGGSVGEASKIMKLKNKPALYDRGFTLWSPVLPRAPCCLAVKRNGAVGGPRTERF